MILRRIVHGDLKDTVDIKFCDCGSEYIHAYFHTSHYPEGDSHDLRFSCYKCKFDALVDLQTMSVFYGGENSGK